MTGAAAGSYSSTSAGPAVQLHDQSISKAGRGTATASYAIASDGKAKNQAGTILESWLISGAVSSYEVRASVTSGAVSSGTTGSWLACSSTQTWSLSNSAADNSTLTAVLLVEIRLASSGVVQASATITLDAESLVFDPGGGGGHQ